MNYLNLLNQLESLSGSRGMKLGLENMFKMDTLLQHPHKNFKCIHVAGTNGKGSVVTKISHGLKLAGFKVGTYTSPHLYCYRERICINREKISEDEVIEMLPPIIELATSENIPVTFFELTTLLAFQYFAKKKVEYAVIETGLGGRLDATNIIHPLLTIITSISLDHQSILGNTLELIAREKGGIIKPNTPLLIGPRVPKKPLEEIAFPLHAPLKQIQERGETFDQENNLSAKEALQFLGIAPHLIDEALRVRPSCRFELVEVKGKKFLFDVAHNPDGFNLLFRQVKREFPSSKLRVIMGMSAGKEVDACLEIVKGYADALYLVSVPHPRLLSAKELYEFALKVGLVPPLLKEVKPIQQVVKEALQSEDLIMITGSFFIMDALKKEIQTQDCDQTYS